MGAFEAITVKQMLAASAAVSAVTSIAQGVAAGNQAEAQARAAQADAAHRAEAMRRQHAAESRKRADLLERATARARVSFGARGIAPDEGSAGALLGGLETDFAEQEAERARDLDFATAGLDGALARQLERIDGGRSADLLARADDVQRRIAGMLAWGERGGGGRNRLPQGDFPGTGLDYFV
jgi:hypothetical protein